MPKEKRRELSEGELDEQHAMEMPDREEMSLIKPPVLGGPPIISPEPPQHPIIDPHGSLPPATE
jgi:hypothetical protein